MKSLILGIIACVMCITTADAARHRRGIDHETTHRHRDAVHVYGHVGPIPVLPRLDDKDAQAASADPLDGLPPQDPKQPLLLAACSYAEVPCRERPADMIAKEFSGLRQGSPRTEIKRIAAAFGFSVGLLNAIAKIESDFNPHERTGSYIGLFQLSVHEFAKYGPTGGSILNARDNAIAAAAKIEDEDAIFGIETRHVPTDSDTYLIHQQGLQGAAEHLAEPDRIAWRSMCATDEGREKGPGWCRRAIWGNTLPQVKRKVGSVDRLTSGSFVTMWANRVAAFLGKPSTGVVVAASEDHKGNTNKRLHEAKNNRTREDERAHNVHHRVHYAVHHWHHRHLARA